MKKNCPVCKNLNVVDVKDPHDVIAYSWCRNCGWASDGREPPRLLAHPSQRRK